MNFFSYISLGIETFSTVMQLIVQFKTPALLTSDAVWAEVQPILVSIGSLTKHPINMTIAQEVVVSAITIIKGKLASA